MKEHFAVASLAGFSLDRDTPSLCAAGAALEYLRSTQMTALCHVVRIERHDPGTTVLLDRSTRRQLDLVEREAGEREGTLLEVLDSTKTAMGGRMLREWILSPLRDLSAIRRRQEGVEETVKDAALRRDLRAALSSVRDVERLLARVATNRANARDLSALCTSLEPLPRAKHLLSLAYSRTLSGLRERMETFDDLRDLLARAIADDPPPTVRDGGDGPRGLRRRARRAALAVADGARTDRRAPGEGARSARGSRR